MSVARKVAVRGQVQGVFFRDSTRRRAAELGLAGWVRNCDDGSVEALFEGEPEAVNAAIEFCRKGPPRAEVAEVAVGDEEPTGRTGFEVR